MRWSSPSGKFFCLSQQSVSGDFGTEDRTWWIQPPPPARLQRAGSKLRSPVRMRTFWFAGCWPCAPEMNRRTRDRLKSRRAQPPTVRGGSIGNAADRETESPSISCSLADRKSNVFNRLSYRQRGSTTFCIASLLRVAHQLSRKGGRPRPAQSQLRACPRRNEQPSKGYFPRHLREVFDPGFPPELKEPSRDPPAVGDADRIGRPALNP